ncbi:hypothetical protein [Cellulomonas endophytica]|uniref:hypothetical protein n=1 Tax=Cellulomonas endophytica TaxID=2494735 RepID=UPI00101059CB|nr:hypothetical protein [Cellulomonas endophytica]
MLTRPFAAVLAAVGVVLVLLGVASATLWRADDVLTATATSRTPLLVTDPGVLELGGDPVTVRVTAPDDAPVVLAVGRDTDVLGWVGTDPWTRVTGLSSWDALATSAGGEGAAAGVASSTAAEPSAGTDAAAPAPAPDPSGSDLWVTQVSGTGSAELVWPRPDEGRWLLLAATTGSGDPTLSLSWPRVVTTPWLWPLVTAGALLVLVALAVWVRAGRRARGDAWVPVTTGAVPVATDPHGVATVPSRRALRAAEQAARDASRRGPRTGAVPTVSGAVPTVSGAVPTVSGATPVGAVPQQPGDDAARATSTPSAPGTVPEPVVASAPDGAAVDATGVDAPRVHGDGVLGRAPGGRPSADPEDLAELRRPGGSEGDGPTGGATSAADVPAAAPAPTTDRRPSLVERLRSALGRAQPTAAGTDGTGAAPGAGTRAPGDVTPSGPGVAPGEDVPVVPPRWSGPTPGAGRPGGWVPEVTEAQDPAPGTDGPAPADAATADAEPAGPTPPGAAPLEPGAAAATRGDAWRRAWGLGEGARQEGPPAVADRPAEDERGESR